MVKLGVGRTPSVFVKGKMFEGNCLRRGPDEATSRKSLKRFSRLESGIKKSAKERRQK